MAGGSNLSGKCPRCGAIILPGRLICVRCGLEFKNAGAVVKRRQAQEDHESRAGGLKLIMGLVVLLGLVAGGYFIYAKITAPGPNPALAYPTSRTQLVRQFFTNISTGRDHDLHRSFLLLSLPMRKKYQDHQGRIWQRMEDLNLYLTGLFGTHWIRDFEVHVKHGKYIAEIATEHFHLRITPQWPTATSGDSSGPKHYGITSIREFSFSGGGASQQSHAAGSILGNLIGNKGAENNVEGIAAAYSNADAGKPWQIKQRLLPIVEKPGAAGVKQCIYQLWPVRNDPTVRLVLGRIAKDPSYAQNLRIDAANVLSGHVMKAYLIANGVTDTH